MTAASANRERLRANRSERLSIKVFGIGPSIATLLRRAARQTLVSRGVRLGQVDVSVVDARQMAQLHHRWKKKRGPTDVLTFDLRVGRQRGRVDGEVIVCKDVAETQAAANGVAPRAELALYVVHGCLHLCGFNDVLKASAARMHRVEDALLVSLGVGRVYYAGHSRKNSPRVKRRSRKARG